MHTLFLWPKTSLRSLKHTDVEIALELRLDIRTLSWFGVRRVRLDTKNDTGDSKSRCMSGYHITLRNGQGGAARSIITTVHWERIMLHTMKTWSLATASLLNFQW